MTLSCRLAVRQSYYIRFQVCVTVCVLLRHHATAAGDRVIRDAYIGRIVRGSLRC